MQVLNSRFRWRWNNGDGRDFAIAITMETTLLRWYRNCATICHIRSLVICCNVFHFFVSAWFIECHIIATILLQLRESFWRLVILAFDHFRFVNFWAFLVRGYFKARHFGTVHFWSFCLASVMLTHGFSTLVNLLLYFYWAIIFCNDILMCDYRL